jgi:hypothetical protein
LGSWVLGLAWRKLVLDAGRLGTSAESTRGVGGAGVSAVWARVSILRWAVEVVVKGLAADERR